MLMSDLAGKSVVSLAAGRMAYEQEEDLPAMR